MAQTPSVGAAAADAELPPTALRRPLVELDDPRGPPSAERLRGAIARTPTETDEERAALGGELVRLLESGALARLQGDGGAELEAVVAARVLELGYPWRFTSRPSS